MVKTPCSHHRATDSTPGRGDPVCPVIWQKDELMYLGLKSLLNRGKLYYLPTRDREEEWVIWKMNQFRLLVQDTKEYAE